MTLFKFQGVSYRDVADEAQAAEHVVSLSMAIAKQPYNVRLPPIPYDQCFCFRN